MANPAFPQEANSTNENNLLKDWYTHDRIRDLVYPDTVFLSMLKKNMDGTGRQYVVPQIFSDSQGTSNTFTKALGNQYPLTAATFMGVPNQKYTVGSIQARLMRQSRDKEGAFLDLMKENIDKTLKNHMNRLQIDLVANDGSGALAQFSALTPIVIPGFSNTYTLQLNNVTQVRYFEINSRLTVADTQNLPSAPATNTGLGTLIQINRTAGILTIAFDPTAVPAGSPAVQWIGYDGDFITNDLAAGATNWQGLAAWIPSAAVRALPSFTDPVQGLFNGVYRAQDSDRLAGTALSLIGSPVKSAFIRLASAIRVNGGRIDVGLLHEFDYASLEESLGPNVRYDNVVLSKEANIGFEAIVLRTGVGEVRLIQDSCVPRGTLYGLQMDTWELQIWADMANIVQDDGLTVLRGGVDDSVQWRARSFGAMVCHAVGFNGVCNI